MRNPSPIDPNPNREPHLHHGEAAPPLEERRTFLGSASSIAMAGGLLASYGTLGAMAGRFLFPAQGTPKGWMFVVEASRLKKGDSFNFRLPSGVPVVITRVGSSGGSDDFLALSSTCPHLGCKVHWESSRDRFFCPCHNGTFDPLGKATGGPPFEAGQSLPRYPLMVSPQGLLFIEAPLTTLARSRPASPDREELI